MKFELNDLKKIVEEAESNKHNEVIIFETGKVLSRKTVDGHWEDITSNLE